MTVVVLDNPVCLIGAHNTPFGQPHLTAQSVTYDGSRILVDSGGRAKVMMVSPPYFPHGVAFDKGFFGDYFNKLYVIPAVFSLIDPALGQPNTFYFWNTYFQTIAITSIDHENDTGLTVNTPLPFSIGDIKLAVSSITVDDSAPSEEIARYSFHLDTGDFTPWTVNLLRTNLLAVSPETPVVELLKWKTAVDAAKDGTEQRASLMQFARVEYQVNYLFLEDKDQKTIYEQLVSGGMTAFSYPIWTEQTRILTNAVVGQTAIQIDVTKFDVKAGDQLYFLGEDETKTESVRVDTVGLDGLTVSLQAGLLKPWTVEDRLFRVTIVKMQDKPSLQRAPYGMVEAKVTLRGLEFRGLFTGSTAALATDIDTVLPDRVLTGSVYTLSGIPIVHARPIVDGSTKIDFDWSFEIIDYEIGAFAMLTDRKIAQVTFDRRFHSNNRLQTHYWNWMLNWMHGKRRPVWLPTWDDEIGPDVDTISGSTILTKSEKFATHYPNDEAHRGVWIRYADGWIARKITDIGVDGQGHTVISLDTAVPNDFPQDGPYEIGFLILARQGSDEVQREWHPAYNFLSTSFVGTKSSPEVT